MGVFGVTCERIISPVSPHGALNVRLDLHFLGPFQARRGNQPLEGITSAKMRALLAYLAVESERAHRRESLAELLWPERPEGIAAQNLRQTLSRLVKALGEAEGGIPYLTVTREMVQFNVSCSHWLDVAELRSAARFVDAHAHRGLKYCPVCSRRLADAVPHYQGVFLQDLQSDSPEFDNWLLVRRERLRRLALDGMAAMAEHAMWLGDYAAAYRYGWWQVEQDGWRESAHQQVMQALAAQGRRGEAMHQFEVLSAVLEQELAVQPSGESVALYQAIRDGQWQPERRQTNLVGPPLPPRHTPLIGRSKELALISERLDHPNCHWLTLVGPGGVGKTRLALETLQEKAGEFRDGGAFAPLAAVESPSGVVEALFAALGVSLPHELGTEHARRSHLLQYLAGREMLIVLDNLEHLSETGRLLAALVAEAPGIKLLVTSRHTFKLHAEWLFDVPGLDYPLAEVQEPGMETGAELLFQACAERRRAGFTLHPANRQGVRRICRLVQGNPLAIELAAAWIREATPAEIAERIGDHLESLAMVAPDLPERHRSPRASFAYSWALLTPDEQALLRALAVFRGGFNLRAVESVTSKTSELLLELAEKSMVQRAFLEQQSGGERYELHELIRQFAGEKLAEYPGEATVTRRQHSEFYIHLFADRFAPFGSHNLPGLVKELYPETANFMTAWTFAVEGMHIELLKSGLVSFTQICQGRGWIQEGIDQLTVIGESLNHMREVTIQEAKNIRLLQCRMQITRGLFSGLLGNPPAEAQDVVFAALTILRDMDANEEVVIALQALAYLERQAGLFQKCVTYLLESMTIARQLNSDQLTGAALIELAFIGYLLNDDVNGKRYAEEALSIFRKMGNPGGEARALNVIGLIAGDQGQYDQARHYLEQSLRVYREMGDLFWEAKLINNLGLVAYQSGNDREAERYYLEFLELSRANQESYSVALAFYNRARIAHRRGDYQQAIHLHGEALAIRQKMENLYLCGVSELYLGRAYLASGELTRADFLLRRSLINLQGTDNEYLFLQIFAGLAAIFFQQGSYSQALRLLGFVLRHPAVGNNVGDFPVEPEARQLVEQIQDQLVGQFDPTMLEVGSSLTLAELTAEYLPREP
jgi:predicted ATPase/DNA-binding SARP family transcriptional activator